MTTNRLVSVLLTVFNAQPYLQEAIESILTQTYADLELIIVDDCSSDDGWPTIVEAAARDRRITPIRRTSRGGASAGLNQGLEIATGAFVTRQDSDDISCPTRLATQVAFLDAHPQVGAVGTAVELIDSRGERYSTWNVPTANEDIQRALLESMCCCGPTMMVRRCTLEQLKFRFDETLSGSEDYDFCLRVAEVTRVANLGEALYLYRQHPSSVSRSREHEQLARKAAALEHALSRRFGSAPAPKIASTVARDYVTAAVMAHFRGASALSPAWLQRARSFDAGVLDDAEWLARVIRACASPLTATIAVARTRSLFLDLLPPSRSLRRLRRQLTSDLHMEEVFAAATALDRGRIRQHLWSAVRTNPMWLANRGVLSLLIKDVLAGPRAGTPS